MNRGSGAFGKVKQSCRLFGGAPSKKKLYARNLQFLSLLGRLVNILVRGQCQKFHCQEFRSEGVNSEARDFNNKKGGRTSKPGALKEGSFRAPTIPEDVFSTHWSVGIPSSSMLGPSRRANTHYKKLTDYKRFTGSPHELVRTYWYFPYQSM